VKSVLGTDEDHDVAILRLESVGSPDAPDAPPLPLGSSTSLKKDDAILSIGSPEGINGAISQGIVTGNRGEVLETNIAVKPAWSGGPLLNLHGEVVGLLTSQLKSNDTIVNDTKGRNFALPIEWATAVLAKASNSLATAAAAPVVSHDFGPFDFKLDAHQRRTISFNTPSDLPSAQLSAQFGSAGDGGHLRVTILRDNQVLYDSSDHTGERLDVKLPQGKYVMEVENTAKALTRDVSISGKFSAAP
jgi:S1-C subfamily serine protease